MLNELRVKKKKNNICKIRYGQRAIRWLFLKSMVHKRCSTNGSVFSINFVFLPFQIVLTFVIINVFVHHLSVIETRFSFVV